MLTPDEVHWLELLRESLLRYGNAQMKGIPSSPGRRPLYDAVLEALRVHQQSMSSSPYNAAADDWHFAEKRK